jgi:hypothetical protein
VPNISNESSQTPHSSSAHFYLFNINLKILESFINIYYIYLNLNLNKNKNKISLNKKI